MISENSKGIMLEPPALAGTSKPPKSIRSARGSVMPARRRRAASMQAENPELHIISQKFVELWNEHDAAGLADLFTEDGDIINPAGLKASGLEEVKTLFEAEFTSNFGMSSYAVRIYSVKSLSEDLAIADWDCTVESVVDDEGTLLQPLTHTAVVVCRKEGADWKFASIRGNSLQD